jgi:NADPH-dependent glutamate synthase beta subunit-like oxidoreductase/NAD-dependent dihydropyrimidine dehydrogenase PreA subunit
MTRSVAVIGDGVGAAQCALVLAEMGADVSLIVSARALSLDNNSRDSQIDYFDKYFRVWPLLLRTARHPRVKVYTSSRVEAVTGKRGRFNVQLKKLPRYVDESLCTSCGQCQEACPVKIPSANHGSNVTHGAIHEPIIGVRSVPAAYTIDKAGTAPCRIGCPLGINIPGFVCLLAKNKPDEALNLISQAAPLAGVLGRVCSHPCEDNCRRSEVDSPVFIKALHRYAADSASSNIGYDKGAVKSQGEKIAIVGSGPSGLAAAWELARRGYSPTIFESHAVVGGMLATGIPRFRLPREVREREVEAIKAMGVDVKTGVIVGRDITISDLREQGYKAFYLAIGAGLNNKLNVPGEDLEGVVDVISMLFALNLKVGTTVGSNVVVIGGGNSAVDSARAVKRRSQGTVRILYRRTAQEMTAIKEHVEEAIEEGVIIEFLTAPVEIIGDGTRVTGIRCQRMKLGKVDVRGRRQPVPIEGSEFTIDADHVVVAIGQRPSTALLRIKDIETNEDLTIKVDPLTLQTNISDVFSGGDCVTGPNTVVDAMAAGIRAAESIDRYLSSRDLKQGRSLERPEPVEVDIKQRYVSPQKRAKMPTLPQKDRIGSYEETKRGLSTEAVRLESGRCLSCALCSGCLECERICQVHAVSHGDAVDSATVLVGAVVNFAAKDSAGKEIHISEPGMFSVKAGKDNDLKGELDAASAIALEVANDLKLMEKPASKRKMATHDYKSDLDTVPDIPVAPGVDERTGVILCHCGGSISSVIDLNGVATEIQLIPGVSRIRELSQVCTEAAAREIKALCEDEKVSRLVVAACRCCNLEQICFSCTEQRVRCQQHLNEQLAGECMVPVEFVNIREQCAWVHRDHPAEATRNAIDIITSGVLRVQGKLPSAGLERPISEGVLVFSTGLTGLASALGVASQGHPVTLVYKTGLKKTKEKQTIEYFETEGRLLKELEKSGVSILSWPRSIELTGTAGNYEAALEQSPAAANVKVGAMVLDSGAVDKILEKADVSFKESLIGRIFSCNRNLDNHRILNFALREISIGDPTGIYILPSHTSELPEKQVVEGKATGARVVSYLIRGVLKSRSTAINIDRRLCRGCGDCIVACPYIEMKVGDSGASYAVIDRILCLGCGACIAACPTGAISQPDQNDLSIINALESLLEKPGTVGAMP